MVVFTIFVGKSGCCDDDNSGSRLTPLTPLMPNGNPRSIKIMEGGYCYDIRYQENFKAARKGSTADVDGSILYGP